MALSVQSFYRFGEFALHPTRRALLRGGEVVSLAPKTLDLLTYLVLRAGSVVETEDVLRAVWSEQQVEESNLTQHVLWLRKALGDQAEYVVTVPGRGYQLGAEVKEVSPESEALEAVRGRAPLALEQIEAQRLSVRSNAASNRWMLAVVGVAGITVGTVVWWFMHRPVPGDHHEVVLAEFQNSTGEADLDKPLNTALAADLRQTPWLDVAGDAQVAATLKLMELSGSPVLTPELARGICQRINAQATLSPAIEKVGRQYLVTLTASDCAAGNVLAQTKAEAKNRDEVLGAVDAVAAQMRVRLGEPLKSLRRFHAPVVAKVTGPMDALKAYTQAHDLGVARLGLARALAMQGNAAASRKEYENFFDGWKDADANLPVQKQARVEYVNVR